MTLTSPTQKHTGGLPGEPKKALAGLLVRKECWTLSRGAKLVILVVVIGACWAGVPFVHQFLAVTSRTNAEYLVMESWIPRYGMQETVTIYKTGAYRKVIASGCSRLDDLDGRNVTSTADAAAITLERFGLNHGAVTAVPCGLELKDRTYNTALAVRAWFRQNRIQATSIDVVTMGPHARRSRLLFQKAFGNQVKIGIIAIEDRSYDSAHWWRSSEGVREVIGEGIAYLYARIFFHPSGAGSEASG